MSAHQPARLAAGARRPAFRRQHSGHTPLLVCGPRPADVPGDPEVHIGGAVAGPLERSTEPAMGGPQGASAGGGLGDQSGQRGVLRYSKRDIGAAATADRTAVGLDGGMPGYGLDPRMAEPSAIAWAPVR
jgi:hypothetical protein